MEGEKYAKKYLKYKMKYLEKKGGDNKIKQSAGMSKIIKDAYDAAKAAKAALADPKAFLADPKKAFDAAKAKAKAAAVDKGSQPKTDKKNS